MNLLGLRIGIIEFVFRRWPLYLWLASNNFKRDVSITNLPKCTSNGYQSVLQLKVDTSEKRKRWVITIYYLNYNINIELHRHI